MNELTPIGEDFLLPEIRELLPAPLREETQLDGALVFVGGDPGEVVVRVRGNKVAVAVFAVAWHGPHTPVVRPTSIGSLNWRRLPNAELLKEPEEFRKEVIVHEALQLRVSNHGNVFRALLKAYMGKSQFRFAEAESPDPIESRRWSRLDLHLGEQSR